ncbi:13705_t:CDS:1, partial [Racocetra persica]
PKPDDLIFIVSSSKLDSKTKFLQVASWSNEIHAFNFYQRNGNEWWWLGSSWHALSYPTRGQGPFDGHVNGSLVMKELNSPWLHWHSQSFTIFDCLNPKDPVRFEPLFLNRSDANELEPIIKGAISHWNVFRLYESLDFTSFKVSNIKTFMRQIIDNTTYNIIASETQYSALSSNNELHLPASFFLNISVFNELSNIGFITLQIPIIKIDAEKYMKSIEIYDINLKDGNRIVEKGDGMFAFPVPEPAYEDTSLFSMFFNQRTLKKKGITLLELLSPKFILCLLMIDFCNPLDSKHRHQLLKYIPDTANALAVEDNKYKYDLEDEIVESIRKNVENLPKHSVEAEFLEYYDHKNL